jgi:hypothetical protein
MSIRPKEYITYALRDVQATWECYQALMRRYAQHGLGNTPAHRLYSEAGTGKAYLKEMNVRPWMEVQPDIPPKLLGIILSTYYGGRSEVHLRRTVSQVFYCDFLSMYPTVCTLMGLWRWIIAKGVRSHDATKKVQRFLDRITLSDLQHRETWPSLCSLVRVQPDDDLFPVRSKYDDEATYTIGLNHLSGPQLWYTLADCIVSKLLTGKMPKVLEAITFAPLAVQEGLRTVCIAGNPNYRVDPLRDDFFKSLIDLRSEVKKQARAANDDEKTRLDSDQMTLKLVANAACYGIYVELNVEALDKAARATCHGADGRSFPLSIDKIEKPGAYFHPLIATFIAGAARLMLAVTERLICDSGLDWAFCDTDSMAIAKPTDMPNAEFWARSQAICDWFVSLNPYYTAQGSLLKIEDVNYGLKTTAKLHPLYCFPVSAKRYALFNIDDKNRPVLRKASAHGLGYLVAPYNEDAAPKSIPKPAISLQEVGIERWHYDLWYRIVEAALAGIPDRVNLDGLPNLDRPAANRYAATSPHLLRWFKKFNEGKPYSRQVRPFNFMHAYQPQQNIDSRKGGVDLPRVVAPFHRDPVMASKKCFDRDSGRPISPAHLKTYRQVLASYHLHPEAKFSNGEYFDRGPTQRRHIRATAICYIGKEANRWEEQFFLGLDPEAQPEYGAGPAGKKLLDNIRRAVKEYGIARLASTAGLSRQYLSTLLKVKSRLDLEIITKLNRAVETLKAGSHAHANETQTILLSVKQVALKHGWRGLSKIIGIDAGTLVRIVDGKRQVSKRMLVRLKVGMARAPSGA